MRTLLLYGYLFLGLMLLSSGPTVARAENDHALASDPSQEQVTAKPGRVARFFHWAFPQAQRKPVLPGFGHAQSQFLDSDAVPEVIDQRLRKSVKKLCACVVSNESCITVFAIQSGGIFATNEHALQFLLAAGTKLPGERKAAGRGECDFSYAFLTEAGKAEPTTFALVERGEYELPDSPPAAKATAWDPRQHYSVTVDRIPDHTRDLSLLRISALKSTPPIPLAHGAKVGEPVFHGGFPAVTRQQTSPVPKISAGTITGLASKNGEADFLGVNGTSGGPVVNSAGELLGIFWGKKATWREADAEFDGGEFFAENGYPRERAFFIPLAEVKAFLP